MKKFGRKEMPSGYSQDDFKYQGRPAKDQDDFGSDVGLADMKCVDQFGKSNKNKFYHAGVVKAKDGTWWVYLEWGRAKPGKSWDGVFSGQDFQFWSCGSEAEARKEFEKQCKKKNIRRLVQQDGIWVGKSGQDGYVVQKLATRESGLPDAYTIVDTTGVETKKKDTKKKTKKKAKARPTQSFHPAEVKLVQDLVGGVQTYVQRAIKDSGGVTPTMETIEEVRDTHIPTALKHIARVSKKVSQRGKSQDQYDRELALACTKDRQLQQLSNFVASLIPRPDPGRSKDAETRALATVLSSGNVLSLQQDLDAFVSALQNADFDTQDDKQVVGVDVDGRMNAKIRWVDPKSKLGKWVEETFRGMTNDRHGHLRGRLTIKNVFTVERPDRDDKFVASVKAVAKTRKGRFSDFARLQPSRRDDLADIADEAALANVFMGIHGTRAVNVAPIVQSDLRLPKSLPGAQITGAAFGHGIYSATDWRKSHGYTGHSSSYWARGGMIKGRGWFMFLQDIIMGKAYMCRSTGSWSTPPNKLDSVAAYPEYSSVVNDEHIIFDPTFQRIRYIVEGDLR